jgi:adenylate kinase family enzyme
MKKAIILRGAPGSGKSTLARKLQGLPQYEGLRIHSTDDYFCGADCDRKAVLPGRGEPVANVELKSDSVSITPRQFGPSRAMLF